MDHFGFIVDELIMLQTKSELQGSGMTKKAREMGWVFSPEDKKNLIASLGRPSNDFLGEGF